MALASRKPGILGGILSDGGILSGGNPGAPQGAGGMLSGLLDNLFAQPGPQNAVSTQMFANSFGSGTDHVNIGTGLPEAMQNRQKGMILQQQFDQAQQDRKLVLDQRSKTRQMLSAVPQALQMYDAGQQDAAINLYVRQKGMMAPNYMTVHPGDSIINANDPGGKPLVDNSGQFAGTDLKAQAWNLINKAEQDPSIKSSPDYKIAVSIVSQPTQQMVQTPNGMVPISQAPVLPDFMTAGGGQAQPAAPMVSGLSPPNSDVAPIGSFGAPQRGAPQQSSNPGITVGAPLKGTKPQPNESLNRINVLGKMAIPDLKNAISDFASLRNPADQLLAKDPTGLTRGLQSPGYQRAQVAVRASISNILYTVSGAAVGDKELERKIDDLTPQFGEDVSVSAQKLDRLASYIDAIAQGSGDQATMQAAKDAEAGIAAAKQQMVGSKGPSLSGKASTGVDWSFN